MHTTFALAVGADGTNAALHSCSLQGKTCIRRNITVTLEASVCLPEAMHPTVALVDQDEEMLSALTARILRGAGGRRSASAAIS